MAGDTTRRGYGHIHQRIRAYWAPIVAAGAVTCWRCRHLIAPDEPWHLGHDDDNRAIWRGPEHKRCNLAAAAAKTNTLRAAGPRISEDW